jgi:signal peptidase I
MNPDYYQQPQKDWLTDLLESFVIAMALSILIFFTIAAPNQVDGQSMEPTFHPEDKLITNKVVQWMGESDLGKNNGWDYQRGDIIIFTIKGQDLVKRIIAAGGDSIMIKEGKVYVNGNLLKENYLDPLVTTRTFTGPFAFLVDGETLIVPPRYYFVMGDNRDNSKDSRYSEIGFVSRDQLRGRVTLRYWPFDKFTWIKRGDFEEAPVLETP